jgi:hypothetical protein
MLHVEDAVLALELQEVIEERDEQGLALRGPEDPLENEFRLGVR